VSSEGGVRGGGIVRPCKADLVERSEGGIDKRRFFGELREGGGLGHFGEGGGGGAQLLKENHDNWGS